MKTLLGCVAPVLGAFGLALGIAQVAAQEPRIEVSVTNGVSEVFFPIIPGVEEFKMLRTSNLGQPFTPATSGLIDGYEWRDIPRGPVEFYRLEVRPKDPNEVFAATLLNRLAYGPTPDELARVKVTGVQAYIQEQLAPETIAENLEIDRVQPSGDWQFVTVTGRATSSEIYIFLTSPGDAFIDDLKIVRGTVPEAGPNMIPSGDFESSLTGWTVSPNHSNSVVNPTIKKNGNSSLHLIATAGGTTRADSISRTGLGLTTDANSPNSTYTLSYWYKPGTNKNVGLVVRLSGADPGTGTLYSVPGNTATRLAENRATINDLVGWHVLHAVQSKKQLLEVMLQFLENHFVTQHAKTRDYFDRFYGTADMERHATNLEYRELQRWRQALLSPTCTFHDLLKISAESPAMIIYLDTVNSRGNGSNIANENYARELLELFTFGVDNGYDQNDITVMSRAWTGWSVRKVDPTNEFNPFAPQTQTLAPGGTNVNTIDNLDGIWAFAYKAGSHANGEKVMFPGATVPARFGAPYAGRNYELRLPPAGREGTDWMHVTQTGTASSSTLYMYITGTGECYIDDLRIVPGSVPEAGPNAVPNGDFENGLTGWTVSSNVRGSTADTSVKRIGNASLRMVSTAAGSSSGTSIRRADLGLTSGATYTLSYWYRPGANMTGDLVIRLSGSGIESSPGGVEGIQDGYRVIQHLADQPFTQEYISVKLCRLFVHDDFVHGTYDFTDPNLSPEGKLVRDCMLAWESGNPKGQIRKVLETIFHSELFRSQAANAQKVKTPLEFVVSAIRTLRGQIADGTYTAETDGVAMRAPLNRMGRMRLFDRDDPDGYPEAGAPWISAGTLAERLRFVQSLLINPTVSSGRGDAGAPNRTDPVRLLKDRLPQSAWNDAGAVADFFLGVIYPGEGKANLAQYRAEAVRFLNTADNGTTTSGFAALAHTSSAYDTRVRGMVASLLTFPRFQEQ